MAAMEVVDGGAAFAKLNDVICGGFNFLVEQLSTMQKLKWSRGCGKI